MTNNDLNRCFPFLMGVVLKIKSYPAGYNEYAAPILINYYYPCSGCSDVNYVRVLYFTAYEWPLGRPRYYIK